MEPIHAENVTRSCPIGKSLAAGGRRRPIAIAIEGLLALAASDVGFDTTFETHRFRNWPAVIGLPTVMPLTGSGGRRVPNWSPISSNLALMFSISRRGCGGARRP